MAASTSPSSSDRIPSVAARFVALIEKRIQTPAFHPNCRQHVLLGQDHVFAVVRETPDRSQLVLALTNVTARNQELSLSGQEVGVRCSAWRDILTDIILPAQEGALKATMKPYQILWLTPVSP